MKKFKNLPMTNYHILGYITFLYMAYVVIEVNWLGWYSSKDYGYYEILRWLVSCFCAWTSIRIYNKNPQSVWLLIFAAITILFNPIFKIALNRDVWQVVDLITIVIFLIYGIKAKYEK